MRDQLLLILALLTFCYAVVFLYFEWRKGRLASPSSLYALLVVIHFALPGMMFGLDVDGTEFAYGWNEDFVADAMLFILISLITFQVGVSLVCRNGRKRSNIIGYVYWDSERVMYYVVSLLIIGWVTRYYIIDSNAYFQIMRTTQGGLEGPFYAAVMMLEMFPMYAACILAIIYWRPCYVPTRILRYVLIFSVLLEILYWLPSGRKEPVVLAILLPLLIRYFRKGILPSLKSIAVIMLAVSALFPIAYIYRNVMEATGADEGLIGTIVAVNDALSMDLMGSNKSTGEIIFGRMSLIEPVSASIRMIEFNTWELQYGSSYTDALLSIIPRVVWSGKPNLHYGTEFGHAAGYLSPDDWLTSISVTFIGEAFLNFSWLGIIPMLLIGMIFGAPYRQAISSARQETWLLVYIITIPTVLYIGGTFALHFGGLIKLLPFFYVIGRLMEKRTAGNQIPSSLVQSGR